MAQRGGRRKRILKANCARAAIARIRGCTCARLLRPGAAGARPPSRIQPGPRSQGDGWLVVLPSNQAGGSGAALRERQVSLSPAQCEPGQEAFQSLVDSQLRGLPPARATTQSDPLEPLRRRVRRSCPGSRGGRSFAGVGTGFRVTGNQKEASPKRGVSRTGWTDVATTG